MMRRDSISFALLFVLLLALASLLLAGCKTAKEYHEETDELIASSLQSDPYANAPLKTFSVRAYRFAFEPDVIEVVEGDHVRITVSSLDVAHGFALPDFGVNEKVPPQESVTVDFIADKAGDFRFFSSVYSGKDYKNMIGRLIVREPAENSSVMT